MDIPESGEPKREAIESMSETVDMAATFTLAQAFTNPASFDVYPPLKYRLCDRRGIGRYVEGWRSTRIGRGAGSGGGEGRLARRMMVFRSEGLS